MLTRLTPLDLQEFIEFEDSSFAAQIPLEYQLGVYKAPLLNVRYLAAFMEDWLQELVQSTCPGGRIDPHLSRMIQTITSFSITSTDFIAHKSMLTAIPQTFGPLYDGCI